MIPPHNPRMSSRRAWARTALWFSLAVSVAPGAQAEIYKYVDENGRVTYTNIPRKGAQTLGLEPKSSAPPGKPKTHAKQATPADFPRVDAATQRGRDTMRRKVLDEELAAETRNLDEARRALTQASKSGGSPGRLADQAQVHQQNIEAIRKEISNLK
jgi:hypothetical protein